jgi:translation initiation factor IF-3
MSMIISRAPGWEPPKKQVPTPATKKHHHTTPATTSETATPSTSSTPSTPVLVQESTEATVPPSE